MSGITGNIGALPAQADFINVYNSYFSPSTVHCKNTGLVRFFERYLLQKAMSPFKYNLPDSWAKNYFLYILYFWGYIGVLNTNRYGVICQGGGLSGYDVFYQPDKLIVINPLFKGQRVECKIGRNCEVIKLQPDWGGVYDIVSYYADLLAILAEAAGINAINTKLAYVFGSKNKTAAETFKKMFDQIQGGNPAVFIDKTLYNDDGSPAWLYFNQDVKSTYIVSDVLEDMKKVEMMFCEEVGIPTTNIIKKERLITDEANANNFEVRGKILIWLECVRESMAKVNDMFGLNLSVELRPELDGGVEYGNVVNNGNV